MNVKRLCSVGCIVLVAVLLSCSPGQPPSKDTPPPTTGSYLATTSTTTDDGALNLAAADNGGRVVSATDELECCPASHLIDGYKLDGGEWWTSEPPQFPQVVVFALAGDQARAIDRVVLNPWTSEWRYAWVKDFEIYASTTSSNLADMGWIGSFTLDHVGIDQTFTFDPVQARYIALVVTSQYGGAEGITLNEFEVYEAPAGTVAAEPMRPSHAGNLVAAKNGGRIVDYSSQDALGNWPAEQLIDGEKDTTTGWSSDSVDGLQYVTFAFGGDQLHRVDRVVLNPYSDQYQEDWIQDFELWGSDTTSDVDAMQELGSFRLEQMGEDQTFTFQPVELRYIALVPTSNYGGTEYALNEFEVYEAPNEAEKGEEIAQKGAGLPQGIAPIEQEGERPPESPPETTNVQTDFVPRTLAQSGASPVDNIEFEISATDLVPVIYHLYGSYFEDLIATTLTNHNAEPVKVRVEAGIPDYTETAVDTLTLAPGETVEVAQDPPLTPEALDLLHSQKNATLHIQIDYLKEGEKRLIYEGTQPLTIYSREDFPWNIPGYYNGTIFLATMVTPNDPALDELMRVAADHMSDGTITMGYGDEYDSDHQVWDRMKAIYDTVAEYYDVTYVAVGTDFVPAEDQEHGFTLQRLKLPYEVLETHSGMCVELSTLFASAFEKIGLRPILITIPSHVYIGVPISWDSNTYYFLEGTLVGRASFEEAVQVGNSQFMEEHRAYLDEDRLDDYFWLDVSEARQEGIWPIPWR
jgi:hypothetical protein